MSKTQSRFGIYLFGLLFVFVAFAVGYFLSQDGIEGSLRRGSVQEAIYGLGKVKSEKIFEFKLGVVSSIRKRYVREGDLVKQGQRLIDFDGNDPLFSPFDGSIVSLPFNDKENVFPQIPILRLEDLSKRFVEVALEQQGALRVKSGQKAKFSFESLRNQIFNGDVESIYPSRDQFFVRIRTIDLPNEVLPGMTADVSIEVGKKENVLLVPLAAISGGMVVRVRNGKREKIEVKIGITDGEWAEVISGDIVEQDKVLLKRKN